MRTIIIKIKSFPVDAEVFSTNEDVIDHNHGKFMWDFRSHHEDETVAEDLVKQKATKVLSNLKVRVPDLPIKYTYIDDATLGENFKKAITKAKSWITSDKAKCRSTKDIKVNNFTITVELTDINKRATRF